MAHFDVARGRYRQLAFGLAVPTRSPYARLLGERYGIEMRAVAGVIVSDSLVAYVQGYNMVSAAAANRKSGRDVSREPAGSRQDLEPNSPRRWAGSVVVSHEAGFCDGMGQSAANTRRSPASVNLPNERIEGVIKP